MELVEFDDDSPGFSVSQQLDQGISTPDSALQLGKCAYMNKVLIYMY